VTALSSAEQSDVRFLRSFLAALNSLWRQLNVPEYCWWPAALCLRLIPVSFFAEESAALGDHSLGVILLSYLVNVFTGNSSGFSPEKGHYRAPQLPRVAPVERRPIILHCNAPAARTLYGGDTRNNSTAPFAFFYKIFHFPALPVQFFKYTILLDILVHLSLLDVYW
jgi:hypothetical protein